MSELKRSWDLISNDKRKISIEEIKGLSPNTLSLVKLLNFERDEKKKYFPCRVSEIFFLKVVAKI